MLLQKHSRCVSQLPLQMCQSAPTTVTNALVRNKMRGLGLLTILEISLGQLTVAFSLWQSSTSWWEHIAKQTCRPHDPGNKSREQRDVRVHISFRGPHFPKFPQPPQTGSQGHPPTWGSLGTVKTLLCQHMWEAIWKNERFLCSHYVSTFCGRTMCSSHLSESVWKLNC